MALNDGLPELQLITATASGTNAQFTNGLFTSCSGTTVNATTTNSTTVSGTTIMGTTVSGTTVNAPTFSGTSWNSAAGYFQFNAGSRFGVTVPLAARTAVSGGDLVGASGGGCYALGAFAGNAAKTCIGVAVNAAPVASGGTAKVLVHGVYDLIATDTVVAGNYVFQGSGTNNVMSTATESAVIFGRALTDTASGATAVVLVSP